MTDLFSALALTAVCGFWVWGVLDSSTRRPGCERSFRWAVICLLAGPLGTLLWTFGPRRRLPAHERVDFWAPAQMETAGDVDDAFTAHAA